MFKSNGGFTLVELIVVIAILGLLAAISVPAYSTYIGKAKDVRDDYQETINAQATEISQAWSEAGLADITEAPAGGGEGGEGSGT